MSTILRLSEPFIRKLEAFGALSNEDKAMLAAATAEARYVDARIDLISEAETPCDLIVILKGFACRYKLREKGSRQILAILLPGDFGELDVACLSRMDHSIATLSACYVVRIAPVILQELQQRPAIARALRKAMLLEVANTREWLFSMGQRTATERAAHLLCELFSRLEAVRLTKNNGYDLPLNQQDLADTIGISVIHMNRCLQQLIKTALISIRSRHIAILDIDRLKKFAEFRGKYLG